MAFLDSGSSAADEGDSGPPSAPPQGGGAPPGGPPGAPPGGGSVLAALANRQRGHQVSAPGPGDMGQSISLIQQAYGFLKQAHLGLPPGSDIERHVGKTLLGLGKFLPQGQPGMGVQQTQVQDLLRNIVKNALVAKITGQMKQPRPGAGQQPAPPGAPPGAMAQAPMPSTPLPGA